MMYKYTNPIINEHKEKNQISTNLVDLYQLLTNTLAGASIAEIEKLNKDIFAGYATKSKYAEILNFFFFAYKNLVDNVDKKFDFYKDFQFIATDITNKYTLKKILYAPKAEPKYQEQKDLIDQFNTNFWKMICFLSGIKLKNRESMSQFLQSKMSEWVCDVEYVVDKHGNLEQEIKKEDVICPPIC